MFNKLSIRNKLVIGIIIGCLFPYFIGGFIIKSKTEEWLYNENIKNTNLLLNQTAKHIDDAVLKNMKNQISMITMDERIINIDSKINSYVDYDPGNFKYRTTKSESDIMAYFRSIKESHDLITLVSIGTEAGGYIEYPLFKPSVPYDPRTREWYMNAIHQKKAIVSEPYITKVTKELVISVDKSVALNGKNIGVASLTIRLDRLMKDINALKYGKTGYVNILSPNNVFLSSPKNEKWILRSVKDLKLATFNQIDSYNGKSFDGQMEGVNKVFNVYISPYSGWKYISVMDKSEVLEQSRAITQLLIFIYIIAFFIMLALIFLISNHITKPILYIANVINKMATFKFDMYEDKDFEIYTLQHDEIGDISKALSSMQENFIELKNNIAVMDEEIQNINIDQRYVYQLKLSKENPFVGITQSVNGLLHKVHSSIEQTKRFTDEIQYKNELLTASEEELTAQLSEIDLQKEYILFLAEHDALTNLPNRRKFNEKLIQVLEEGKNGAVLLLDLDNFKGINDTLGHLFGDKVLEYISRRLETFANHQIFVSRFGGDEFLFLYEYKDSNDDVLNFVKQLFELFNEKFVIEQIEIKMEFSIGISLFPKNSQEINELIMYADLALYFIKNNGKNDYSFFSNQMAEQLKLKQVTKTILKEAIENDGFKMVYQPQVDINTGEVVGYEALIRLKSHNISPADFIAIAEEDSTIIAIGRIVTKLVLEQMQRWKQKGLTPKPVAINFSAVQILDSYYKTYLLEMLKEYDVNPEHIVIEITENIFLENKETTTILLNELRAHGIKIAIDDFGTGYSSLSYLTFLPIDTIKLDRTLNSKFLELENIAVMDSLIALAHSLNLKVIAEGIEEEKQVKRLIVGKCDIIQGYYFSKPLEVEEVEENYHKIYN